MRKLSGILMLAFLSGCSSMTSPARDHIINDQLTWVDFAADRRGAWIVLEEEPNDTPPQKKASKRKINIKICAEPFPDTADNLKGGGSGSYAGSSVQFSGEQTKVELTGRSSAVLALRESLYRICELSMMGALNPEQTAQLVSEAIRSMDQIGQAEVAASPAASVIRDLNSARKFEAEGFDALLHDKWPEAQKAFENSEQSYPTYHGSYEFARAIRLNKDNTSRAKAILESRAADYLPADVKNHLKSVK